MKRENKGTYDSSMISIRGDVRAKPHQYRRQLHKIPEIGSIIVYCDNLDRIFFETGRYGSTLYGIGQVVAITGNRNCLLQVKKFQSPNYNSWEFLRINDIVNGLVLYRELKSAVYTSGKYKAQDFDLRKPHPDICKLFKTSGGEMNG